MGNINLFCLPETHLNSNVLQTNENYIIIMLAKVIIIIPG